MSGMNEALWPLRMKVVSANAASPSGAGSAAGIDSTSVGRARSSARTAMATSFVAGPPANPAEGVGWVDRNPMNGRRISSKFLPRYEAGYTSGLGREVVRVVRQHLGAVLGHEH